MTNDYLPSDADPAHPPDLQPPSYDTLSIAAPSFSDGLSNTQDHAPSLRNNRNTLKSFRKHLGQLREEDAEAKKERLRYVSPEEADRITGLDKRREEEEEGASDIKGTKTFLALMCVVS